MSLRTLPLLAACGLLALPAGPAVAQGEKASSPVELARQSDRLKPGQWVWAPQISPQGPLLIRRPVEAAGDRLPQRLAAKLDCNRGTGPWRAAPADAGGGALSLGPLATARMMCPPDPVGDRLARDVETVRSYRMREGRLHLVLPADAGVYVWERVAP